MNHQLSMEYLERQAALGNAMAATLLDIMARLRSVECRLDQVLPAGAFAQPEDPNHTEELSHER